MNCRWRFGQSTWNSKSYSFGAKYIFATNFETTHCIGQAIHYFQHGNIIFGITVASLCTPYALALTIIMGFPHPGSNW